MRLETELQVLSGFTPRVRAALPFRVPSVAGAVRLEGMRTFVYHDLPGRELDLEQLTGLGDHMVADIGRVIAAIHALPAAVVENADLPSYSADQFRTRRLNELDQAATTGRIPPVLLRRWENALEEKELWEFTPTVVHGDLHEDNLLVHRGRLVAVTGWTDLHIGDPAEDFAWLASAGDQDFAEAVLAEYSGHLTGEGGSGIPPELPGFSDFPDDDLPADPFGPPAPVVQLPRPDQHLLRRAALSAEFALAQWLVRGVNAGDEGMIGEAEEMLRELQLDVEQHGGQDISLSAPVPLPDDAPLARAEAASRESAEVVDATDGTDELDDTDASGDLDEEDRAGSPASDQLDEDEDQDGAVITDADAADSSDEDSANTASEPASEQAVAPAPDAAPDQVPVSEQPAAAEQQPERTESAPAESTDADEELSASQAALARLRQRRTQS